MDPVTAQRRRLLFRTKLIPMATVCCGGVRQLPRRGQAHVLSNVVLNLVLAVSMAAAVVAATPRMPKFSWDTVPVFYHSCNYSGPFSAEAVSVIARFPLVVVEKVSCDSKTMQLHA